MAGNTKNLGQVAGVYIGNTPPENIILIWYDNTPSQMRHKIYDPGLSQWVVLDQNVISLITYSELVNIAKNVGLSIGQYFQIKDKGNALALAITTTKVQYDDELGNILIDDLGTNIQYHVTSSNLLVDDVAGVFDTVNKKLVFQFKEMVPDFTADDYIMGKVQRNNVWSLAKYRLSSFLSKVTGNSISWNGGFFFNFGDALKAQLDKKGGVVAKDTYDTDMQKVNQDIANVGKANQQIIYNANKAITDATSDTAIYAKKSPALETGGEPTDAAKGDSLLTILSKFQRYITRFKYATGIRVSQDFTDAVQPEYVNNNDTVDSALRKIQYWLKNAGTGSKLSPDWTPKDYAGTIADVAGGDSLDEAFAKAIGKLNQIGTISNGQVRSKATTSGGTSRTIFNLASAILSFYRDGTSGHNVSLSSSSGLSIKDSNNYGLVANGDGLDFQSQTQQIFDIPAYEKSGLSNVYGGASALYRGRAISTAPGYASLGIISALSAVCNWNGLTPSGGYQVFDAYFANFKAGGLSLGLIHLSSTDLYLDTDCSFVSCTNSENKNVFLPANPHDGQLIIVNQVNSANVAVHGNGRRICDNTNVDSVNIGSARSCGIFVFNPNIATDPGYKWGMWVFERWSR